MNASQQTLLAMYKHERIAQFINLIVACLLYIKNINVWWGLLIVVVSYSVFEFAQKKLGGKNTFKRQVLTVLASTISYIIYAILLTGQFLNQ